MCVDNCHETGGYRLAAGTEPNPFGLEAGFSQYHGGFLCETEQAYKYQELQGWG